MKQQNEFVELLKGTISFVAILLIIAFFACAFIFGGYDRFDIWGK